MDVVFIFIVSFLFFCASSSKNKRQDERVKAMERDIVALKKKVGLL